MGDRQGELNTNTFLHLCIPIDALLITGRAELFRRRIAQRAVRPDRVIFPPVPERLRSSIRNILEFYPLQEFVTQPTVKRFDIAILPGASRSLLPTS